MQSHKLPPGLNIFLKTGGIQMKLDFCIRYHYIVIVVCTPPCVCACCIEIPVVDKATIRKVETLGVSGLCLSSKVEKSYERFGM